MRVFVEKAGFKFSFFLSSDCKYIKRRAKSLVGNKGTHFTILIIKTKAANGELCCVVCVMRLQFIKGKIYTYSQNIKYNLIEYILARSRTQTIARERESLNEGVSKGIILYVEGESNA